MSMRAYFGITIERDPDFTPCRLSEVVVMEQGLQRFALGQLAITPGALAAFQTTQENPYTYLQRHAQGDWGELVEEDVAENEYAVTRPLRLLSAYKLADGTRIWIITEADRSVATILLPEEY